MIFPKLFFFDLFSCSTELDFLKKEGQLIFLVMFFCTTAM